MRSATSYFNSTLYRKTLARFWPLWAAYTVIWLFCIPLNMLNTYFQTRQSTLGQIERIRNQALDLPQFATFGLYFAGFFAILCAMAVFGYLYNSRSACWTHALPMRREALFTTQYLAGLSFLLLPQLAAAALTAIIEMAFLPMGDWGGALSALLVWLLAQSGICLFFFSFAAFCAMFTGNILALPAFYAILNVLATVIYSLLEALMAEFFYGYNGSLGAERVVEYLTPGFALKDALILYGRSDFDGYYYQSPGTIAAYAVVGVVLAVIALYVYRRRHVETAGDVVAIPLVRPVFKYGVSLCAGLSFGMFTATFFSFYDSPLLIVSILIWAVVGYFVAEMLLRKSFRVFKAWKGAAVMTVLLLALCVGCACDLFGVVRYVPSPEQVESVHIRLGMGYPYDDGRWLTAVLTDPEQIQEILDLHRAVVNDPDRGTHAADDFVYLAVDYTLSGGRTLNRSYNSVPINQDGSEEEGSVLYALRTIYGDRELVAEAYGFDDFLEGCRLSGVYLAGYQLDKEDPFDNGTLYLDGYEKALWEAVLADFDEGTIGARWPFEYSREHYENTYHTELVFEATREATTYPQTGTQGGYTSEASVTVPSTSTLTVTLTPQARHTLAVLEQTGIFEEGYSLIHKADFPSGSVTYYRGAVNR